jgi:hypothetical protein
MALDNLQNLTKEQLLEKWDEVVACGPEIIKKIPLEVKKEMREIGKDSTFKELVVMNLNSLGVEEVADLKDLSEEESTQFSSIILAYAAVLNKWDDLKELFIEGVASQLAGKEVA